MLRSGFSFPGDLEGCVDAERVDAGGQRLRVRAGERGAAFQPAAEGFDALLRGTVGKKRGGFFGPHLWGEMAKRGDVVDDPDTTAVRGNDEIGITGMDDEIAHRHAGKIVA